MPQGLSQTELHGEVFVLGLLEQGIDVGGHRDLNATDHLIKICNELCYDWFQSYDICSK